MSDMKRRMRRKKRVDYKLTHCLSCKQAGEVCQHTGKCSMCQSSPKTIKRLELHPLLMEIDKEGLEIVIDEGVKCTYKKGVWLNLGPASPEDYKKYPVVVD